MLVVYGGDGGDGVCEWAASRMLLLLLFLVVVIVVAIVVQVRRREIVGKFHCVHADAMRSKLPCKPLPRC